MLAPFRAFVNKKNGMPPPTATARTRRTTSRSGRLGPGSVPVGAFQEHANQDLCVLVALIHDLEQAFGPALGPELRCPSSSREAPRS